MKKSGSSGKEICDDPFQTAPPCTKTKSATERYQSNYITMPSDGVPSQSYVGKKLEEWQPDLQGLYLTYKCAAKHLEHSVKPYANGDLFCIEVNQMLIFLVVQQIFPWQHTKTCIFQAPPHLSFSTTSSLRLPSSSFAVPTRPRRAATRSPPPRCTGSWPPPRPRPPTSVGAARPSPCASGFGGSGDAERVESVCPLENDLDVQVLVFLRVEIAETEKDEQSLNLRNRSPAP